MLTKSLSIPVVWSYKAPGGVVKLPSSVIPGLTHTPGFIAAHKDNNLSTLAWCKKKIGSNADDKNKNRRRQLSVSMLTSDSRVCHVAPSADIDVNTVVNAFQAVTGTSTVTYSMVAECWPSVNSCQHVICAWRDIALRRSQNTGWNAIRVHSTQESYINLNVLLEHRDIVGSIGILARWLPECSRPTAVRIRERWVNGMKFVLVQWIVDCDFVPIFAGDGNLLLRDNLFWRDGVLCPIPERLAKFSGGLLPVLCVDCICRSDFFGQLLQNLLIKWLLHQSQGQIEEGYRTNLVKHNVGSMPGREKGRTMRTVSSPLTGVRVEWGIAYITVPSFIRKTMDSSNTEKGLDDILVVCRHTLWQKKSINK